MPPRNLSRGAWWVEEPSFAPAHLSEISLYDWILWSQRSSRACTPHTSLFDHAQGHEDRFQGEDNTWPPLCGTTSDLYEASLLGWLHGCHGICSRSRPQQYCSSFRSNTVWLGSRHRRLHKISSNLGAGFFRMIFVTHLLFDFI